MNRTIIDDLPMRDYLALADIAASDLKAAARSMRHFQIRQSGGDSGYSPALAFGTLFHTFMEVNEVDFWHRHAIVPAGIDKRTKEYKAFKEEHRGKTLISMDEARQLEGMKASVFERYGDLLRRPHRAEAVVLWKDPEFGVACKCRPDWWENESFDGEALMIDYKTTHDARVDPFSRDIHNFNYILSVPHYLEGTGATRFAWLAVEKEPPYLCALHVPCDTWIESATRKRIELLKQIDRARKSKEYPGYTIPSVNIIEPPRWAYL